MSVQWDGLAFSEVECRRQQLNHQFQHYPIQLAIPDLQISTSICRLFIDFQEMKNIRSSLSQSAITSLSFLAIGLCGHLLSNSLKCDLHIALAFALALTLIGKERAIYNCMLGSFILNSIIGVYEQLDTQRIIAISTWSALSTFVQCKVFLFAARRVLGNKWRTLFELKDFIKLLAVGSAFSSLIPATFHVVGHIFRFDAESNEVIAITFLQTWLDLTLGSVVLLPIFLGILLRKTAIWENRYKAIAISALLLVGLGTFVSSTNRDIVYVVSKAQLDHETVAPLRLITTKVAALEAAVLGFGQAALVSSPATHNYLTEYALNIFIEQPSVRSLTVIRNRGLGSLLPGNTFENQGSTAQITKSTVEYELIKFSNPRYPRTPIDPEVNAHYEAINKNLDIERDTSNLRRFSLLRPRQDSMIAFYQSEPKFASEVQSSQKSTNPDTTIYIEIDLNRLITNEIAIDAPGLTGPWLDLQLGVSEQPISLVGVTDFESHISYKNERQEPVSLILFDHAFPLIATISPNWLNNHAWRIILPLRLIKLILVTIYMLAIFVLFTRQARLRLVIGTQQGTLQKQYKRLALFQQSIEHAQEAIAILQMQSDGLHITYVNRSFSKMAGEPEAALIGAMWSTHIEFPINEKALGSLRQSIDQSVSSREEVIAFNAKSEWLWIDLTLTPIRQHEGKPSNWVLTQQDVSERKRTNLELKRAELEARNLSAMKSRFLANMSHEIRTPLSGIIGLSNLVQDEHDPKAIQQYVKTIRSSASHQLDIITSILDALRIEAAQIRPTIKRIDLHALLNQTVEILRPNAQLKGIALNPKISNNAPELIESDPLFLKQILLNLMSNAIKFTQKGQVDITIEYLSADSESTCLRFIVADSGVGLRSLTLGQITKPFFKGDLDDAGNTQGLGLGLAIVEAHLQQLGSYLQVITSNSIGGATFYFDLNCRYVDRRRQPLVKSDVPDPITDTHRYKDIFVGLRFLLIEDNLINQIVLLGFLNDSGATIDIASKGDSALSKIIQNEYDLVLLDLRIPKFDTTTVATELAKLRQSSPNSRKTPIIGLSASQQDGYEATLLRYGLSDFLTKPVGKEHLYGVITQHVFSSSLENVATSALSGSINTPDSVTHTPIDLQHLFLEQAAILRPIFNRFFDPDHYQDLLDALHIIQGSAASLGKQDLQRSALNVEKAIRTGADPRKHQSHFLQLYDHHIMLARQHTRAKAERNSPESESPLATEQEDNARHLNVLLIDDNELVCQALGRQFKESGLSVDYAYSCQEALLKLDMYHYDVLIIDLALPEMNGIDLMKMILTQPRLKNQKVFGLSANVSDPVIQACKDAGMMNVYSKLHDPVMLIAALSAAVEAIKPPNS